MNADDDMEITLPILQSIEQQSNITQRSLAKRLGLALGLTNAYLKHCVTKGLVKIEQIPANRYLYYLTPKGFAEKGRLTAEYLSRSFHFYRKASDSCFRLFTESVSKGCRKVLLCGLSDLTDIALLQAARAEINVVGIFDPRDPRDRYMKYAVWHSTKDIPDDVVVVVTSLQFPRRLRRLLQQVIATERVLAPDILGL